jgi:glycosyltransferase involved in cell wall biosynthesis
MSSWLNDEAAAGRIDVLHNHSLWMLPNVYPGLVARRHGIPYVVSPRGTLSEVAFRGGSAIKRLMWPLLQRPSLVGTSCFVSTCKSESADIRASGFDAPIANIPNGIDVPSLAQCQGARRTILYLGRIHPIKQIDVLIAAWARIACHAPEWDLRIIGPDNGGHLHEIKGLAARLGAERISFEGEFRGERKTAAYREADLYVLPTKSENFGVTVAEALAAGTPAIVTDGAPWDGLVAEGAGWWIPQGVDAMERTLRHAMSLPRRELQAMGRRGREWMLRSFSWHGVSGQMSDVYRWIVEGMPELTRPSFVLPGIGKGGSLRREDATAPAT